MAKMMVMWMDRYACPEIKMVEVEPASIEEMAREAFLQNDEGTTFDDLIRDRLTDKNDTCFRVQGEEWDVVFLVIG